MLLENGAPPVITSYENNYEFLEICNAPTISQQTPVQD